MLLRRLAFLTALALGGCAHGPTWRNPSIPEDQWSADETACRREAEEDIGPQPGYSPPDAAKFDSPMQMVERSEVQDRFANLVASCMERKGYRRSQ